MLLDRIDIDVHGPLHRVELGPFSEQLNVICGPDGSGKTAIARFVRDSLVDRDYPLGMMSSSTGRVVWADRNGIVHCRREQDGTPHGRTTVEFEARGDYREHYSHLRHSWISNVTESTDHGRATAAIQFPASLVEGVITDTTVTNVGQIVLACVRAGLDSPEATNALPFTTAGERDGMPSPNQDRAVRRELADVEAEILRIGPDGRGHDELVARRNELQGRLDRPVRESRFDRVAAQRRLTELCQRARDLRARQSDLRARQTDRHRWHNDSLDERVGHSLDERARRDLDDLDGQMVGWRRTLYEVRGLREAMLSGESTYRHGVDSTAEEFIRRQRLDGLLDSVDRYARPVEESLDRPRRPVDIHERVDSATRQIDWLLERYSDGDRVSRNWFDTLPASNSYRAATTLGDTLRAIRSDLQQARQATKAYVGGSRELDELRQCERWLVSAIDQLQRHRESLLARESRHVGRRGYDAELDRINIELDACLAEAAEIRRSLRVTEGNSGHQSDWSDRDAVLAEIRRIDDRLATLSRLQWLQVRREHLRGKLRHDPAVRSPLAQSANHWLTRLSAGRHRKIEWARDSGKTGVRIDGREESRCPSAARALAAMAVRMAAGDLLAGMGRSVPLIVETHSEWSDDVHEDEAYAQRGTYGRANHPVAAALQDYSRPGRQVILLTSHRELAAQLTRCGAREFELQPQQVIHAHRPIWRPHYEAERYVGPHPHTYGTAMAPPISDRTPVVDINRDFDVAWREDYGVDDNAGRQRDPVAYPASPSSQGAYVATDVVSGSGPRDGYYYADSYTTVPPATAHQFDQSGNWVAVDQPKAETGSRESVAPVAALHQTIPESPFFLSVDSPIDQAPSVDAVAAARLRGLNVTHINHLMQQDSNRLADALGLASVNAATIRRWQSECRLMCRVPQLRGFDARILVGCGVTDPAQLAGIHPVDLLQEVEAFLATDGGQKILLSGTSHELSRITSWIAAANSSPAERAAASARNGDRTQRSNDNRESMYAFATSQKQKRESGRRVSGDTNSNGRSSTNARSQRGDRRQSNGERSESSDGRRRSGGLGGSRSEARNVVRYRQKANSKTTTERAEENASGPTSDRRWRFYLERENAVEDAPSIGARMAERLGAVGIVTVADLLEADAESLANELNHRRVDAEVIVAWQQQAELVCRVPMLRGHDAQLLVMAEVTSPEELSGSDAEELFQLIEPICHTKEGQRVIRGGKLPDLAEVTDWVDFAQHTRELKAA